MIETFLAGLADLVDFVDVEHAALGGFDVEVGRVQQFEQQVFDVFADVAGFGQAWWHRRWRTARSASWPACGPASVLPEPVGPISRMLDFSISTS